MIPRFGRVLPITMSVLGMFDARYSWQANKALSIFLICLVVYLIYFMCKNHAAVSPKKVMFNLVVPFVVMVVIVLATYLIFF